jgi:glutamate-1-semialdehyde 2,1-aminomutase
MTLTNASCWRDAKRYLVGGVNSPVRSFQAVGGSPIFADRGRGAYLWDVEGHRFIDYVLSWGALILGHRHPEVIQAVNKALRRGTTFGTPTRQETELAKAIAQAIPSMEQVRFVSSGTEAAMSAIRLARAATGRRKILKFEGGYHGHFGPLLTKAGSGMMTLGLPASPGVPKSVTEDTLTIPFNDAKAASGAIRRFSSELACVLVEPVLANVGVIPPEKNFLEGLRRITKEKKILLIFDEVITGFRVAYGGAQALFRIQPDLTILGKAIGGGFPIGAYGGSRKFMDLVAPAGPVYQAGTLAGHPVAMAAGLATLQALRRPGTYERLSKKAADLRQGLLRLGQKHGIALTVHQVGGLLSLFFSEGPIRNAADAKGASSSRYARYFRGMLAKGIYLPPSAYESWFLSTAHGEKDLEKTLRAHRIALSELRTRNSELSYA